MHQDVSISGAAGGPVAGSAGSAGSAGGGGVLFSASPLATLFQLMLFTAQLVLADVLTGSELSVVFVSILAVGSWIHSLGVFANLLDSINHLSSDLTLWHIANSFVIATFGVSSVTLFIWVLDPSDDGTGNWNGFGTRNSVYSVGFRVIYLSVIGLTAGDAQFTANSDLSVLWVIYMNIFGVFSNIILFGLGINVIFRRRCKTENDPYEYHNGKRYAKSAHNYQRNSVSTQHNRKFSRSERIV